MLGILTSTVYQTAQQLCLALVPGAERGDDGAEVQAGEVTVPEEAGSPRQLPTDFAGQQQEHFREFLFFQQKLDEGAGTVAINVTNQVRRNFF